MAITTVPSCANFHSACLPLVHTNHWHPRVLWLLIPALHCESAEPGRESAHCIMDGAP